MPGHYIILLVNFTGQDFRILVSGHFAQLLVFLPEKKKVANTCTQSLLHIISDFHLTRVMNTAIRSICQIINIFSPGKRL